MDTSMETEKPGQDQVASGAKGAGDQPAHAEEDSQREGEASFQFSDLERTATQSKSANMEFILEIPLAITIELGRTRLTINDLLQLGQGSVIKLDKLAGETLDILANKSLIARGEVVLVNQKYGIRVTEIVSPMERIKTLK